MKIGLVDVDYKIRKPFPNIALMKISKYHKNKGDFVELANIGNYDILYYSKIFTFSKEKSNLLLFGNKIIKGGIGYKKFNKLPDYIDKLCPDYSLYNCEHAYGFLSRGCIRKCDHCVVPISEGNIQPNQDIEEFLENKKSAILMDNNILSFDYGLQQIEKIIKLGVSVDFNQGLDARIISENKEISELLSKVKWLHPLRMACDHKSQMESILKATKLLRYYGATPKQYFCYVLVKDIEDALERVTFLKKLNIDAFAQPYINFEDGFVDKKLKKFARWVNCKQLRNVEWKDYKYSS